MPITTEALKHWDTKPEDLIEYDEAVHGKLRSGDIDDPDITIVIGLQCPQCQADGIEDEIDLVYHPSESGPCAAGIYLAHTYLPNYLCEQGHIFISQQDLEDRS